MPSEQGYVCHQAPVKGLFNRLYHCGMSEHCVLAFAGHDSRLAAGFDPSERVAKLRDRVRAFMQKHVYPAEPKLEVL